MEKFSGGHKGLRNWVTQARARIHASSTVISDPRALFWAVGHLKGDAADWWLARVATYKNDMGGFANFEEFAAELVSYFSDPNPADNARDKLKRLRQTTSAAAYASAFTQNLLELPNRDEGDNVYDFVRGLKPSIQQLVAQQQPATLMDAIKAATIADRIFMATKNPTIKASDQHRSSFKTTRWASDARPTPMDVDINALTTRRKPDDKTRWHRYDSSKCNYCKEPGHWKRDCPHLSGEQRSKN